MHTCLLAPNTVCTSLPTRTSIHPHPAYFVGFGPYPQLTWLLFILSYVHTFACQVCIHTREKNE